MAPFIETDAEHEAALERMWALMDAEDGSPKAQELAAIAERIEAYEEKRYG